MCGILALFGQLGKVSRHEIKNATNAITHRGPDDEGMSEFDGAILAFRRLSIIDLSYLGHQPMSDSTGRYWIIFNGEIYNHQLLREILTGKGYAFKSSTDTEAILYGYIHFGEKVLEYLDGMFSFVIYDSLSGDVFAARDRMGKKPMLYYQKNDLLILFSELKQIVEFSFFERTINKEAISLYLSYGSIPSPMTIFESVKQVPPGHYLTYRQEKLLQTEYWKPRIDIDRKMSYQDALRQTHDLVVKSITKRLISDVPLGAFLSGGIDSSIITAVMANRSSNVKTFSIKYSDAPDSYDESYYANLIVEQYQTVHSTITISPNDVYDNIEKIIWHMDQPSGDAINTYFVSQSARRGVTVSLSGVGGDEIFAGYSTFKFANTLKRFRVAKQETQAVENRMDRLFFSLPNSLQINWKVRMLAGSLGAFSTNMHRYNLIKEIYRNEEIARLSTDNSQYPANTHYLQDHFDSSLSEVQQVTMAEVNNYLKSTLLRDADVMGMAHSLEIRCPFIDHELIEFALTIPDPYKIKNLDTKIILKEAFKKYLPEEIIHRKKMGFAFPLSAWLKTGKLKDLVEDCLSESSIKARGIFDYNEVKKVKDAYFSLKQNNVQTYQYYQKVWLLVILELWFRKYINED